MIKYNSHNTKDHMLTGAQLLVTCLENLNIQYVFGIPGAKIDAVFDALVDSKIKLILCRNEQNAVYMASSYARLTNTVGVVIVTSGPGVSNLVTGLLTATTEGYPIIAIGANVPQNMMQRSTHQCMNNIALMESICKHAIEIHAVENIPEAIVNASRLAKKPNSGACFISVPQDILNEKTKQKALKHAHEIRFGQAPEESIKQAIKMIEQAKRPILFLGMNAAHEKNSLAINEFLRRTPMPVISNFQAAGLISEEHMDCFAGHVGLFKNAPADRLLEHCDLIISIGFKPIEYDPEIWNLAEKPIIHLDYEACTIQSHYQVEIELCGDIASNLKRMQMKTSVAFDLSMVKMAKQRLSDEYQNKLLFKGPGIHPIQFMHALKNQIKKEDYICCDVGSSYIWMARYFFSHQPHQLFFSNGQQTLGVALPWALGCRLARTESNIISISGDGAFLFSAAELETAVREQLKIIHFIWTDGSYNMVKEQQLLKYGRASGVELGRINIPAFASAFSALGLELKDIRDFEHIWAQALQSSLPVLIDVQINYSDNQQLFEQVQAEFDD